MIDFINRNKKIVFVVFFILLTFTIFSTHNKKEKKPIWHENVLVFFIAPFQNMANFIGQGVGSLFNKYFFLIGLYEENEALRKENIKLRGINFLMKEIEQENLRLRNLLDFKKQTGGSELLAAEVVAVDANSDFKSIRINKGKLNGVREQLPVVTYEGIVGQIVRAYTNYSDVLLITDRYSFVDAIIQRIRSRGVLEGNISDCKLKHVFRRDDVKKHDLVVSSGLDLVFPKLLGIFTFILSSFNLL